MDQAEFIRGINLINGGHYFEAHEVLEDLWRPMPLSDPHRSAMQGLVQIAVALHHLSTGNRTGALSVMKRAARNLAPAPPRAFGIDMDRVRQTTSDWISHVERHQTPPATPRIEFLND